MYMLILIHHELMGISNLGLGSNRVANRSNTVEEQNTRTLAAFLQMFPECVIQVEVRKNALLMSEDHVKEFIRSAKTVFSKKLHKTLSSSRGGAVDPPWYSTGPPCCPSKIA